LSAGLSVSKPKLTLSEREIEQAILTWLNYQPKCKAWKNKSQGTYDPYKKVFRKPSSKFTEKGTSDILGIWNGKMLCIEVKSAKGRLSPEQKSFLQEMANLGAICLVARSLDAVIDAFSEIFGTQNSGQSDFC
jgi:penicillin-binding protein-related factor A (putative recombinase)